MVGSKLKQCGHIKEKNSTNTGLLGISFGNFVM